MISENTSAHILRHAGYESLEHAKSCTSIAACLLTSSQTECLDSAVADFLSTFHFKPWN